MGWARLGILASMALLTAHAQTVPVFEKDVFPVLQAKCVACHGPSVRTAGLDLHEASRVLRGGDNGPVVVQGAPEKSLLWTRVKAGTMPPGKEKLTAAEIDVLKRWIEAGALTAEKRVEPQSSDPTYRSSITAKDRQFWAFRPLAKPSVPNTGVHPVDAFLLEKLKAKGLHYSPAAAARSLIRRASLDLIGLPPTPDEVDAFVNDRSPDAFAKVVDRLLSSPHFGERWGRFWLDLAGYVDVVGRDVQATGYRVGEGRYKYRDYVIRAYQNDKPYNEFLQEQIAGDELFNWRSADRYTPGQLEKLVATGYLRTAEDPTDNPERDTPLLRYEVLHQTVDILTSSVMGLTVSCARCHNHKFDPIPQRDYYRLMATLTPAYNPEKWTPVLKRTMPEVPPSEAAAIQHRNQELDAKRKPLEAERDKLTKPFVDAWLAESLQKIPEKNRPATQKAFETAEPKRNARQKTLVASLGKFDAARLPADLREQVKQFDQQIAALNAQRVMPAELESLFDTGTPPETYIHRRGDHESKGSVVGPGGLEALSPNEADFQLTPPFSGTSGRRLALAKWLTAEGTPAASLVSRVYVNRVWSHLFGRGLVGTTENFGSMGERPSHPELLEWITAEFQRNGWRTKPLLRTLMLSTAYQQSSIAAEYRKKSTEADPETNDPENQLLHRMRLKRLESEAIRDSMLAVSGKLNPRIGGPAVKTIALADGMVIIDPKALASPDDKYRRSLYLVARRRYNLSIMGVFDHPVMSTNATTRGSSAVVLQSLMMMNDAEVHEQSLAFADRMKNQGADIASQVDAAFRHAFGRSASGEEKDWALSLYARERDRYLHASKSEADATRAALASVCHVLLNANEFLYVE